MNRYVFFSRINLNLRTRSDGSINLLSVQCTQWSKAGIYILFKKYFFYNDSKCEADIMIKNWKTTFRYQYPSWSLITISLLIQIIRIQLQISFSFEPDLDPYSAVVEQFFFMRKNTSTFKSNFNLVGCQFWNYSFFCKFQGWVLTCSTQGRFCRAQGSRPDGPGWPPAGDSHGPARASGRTRWLRHTPHRDAPRNDRI